MSSTRRSGTFPVKLKREALTLVEVAESHQSSQSEIGMASFNSSSKSHLDGVSFSESMTFRSKTGRLLENIKSTAKRTAIVGPGGIFVVETKTKPRRKPTRPQPDHEVHFNGQTLHFPWCYDYKATQQAIRNTEWVQRFIEGFGPKAIKAQPIIVVPGWFVKVDGDYEVKAMNAKYLASNFIPSLPKRFSPDDLKPIVRRLKPIVRRFDERCRDLEF